MSLRRAILVFASSFAFLAILASGGLILLTTYLHRTASGIESALESIHLAEQMQVQLLSHDRSKDSLVRVSIEDDLRLAVRDAQEYVGTAEEQRLLSEVGDRLALYFRASRSGAVDGTYVEFDQAFGSVRQYVQLNVQQARELNDLAAQWDRLANTGAKAVAALLTLGLAGLLYWLRRAAFQPAIELSNAIERYSLGDRSARASEDGAAEFRSIARRFNEMASTLERQRGGQLAFLAGVAHDLRNPLSALKLASDVISANRPLPSEARIRQAFTRAQRQIDRLDRMVYDLLDATRIEAGALHIQLEECDPIEVVRSTLELFEPTAPRHRLVIHAPAEPLRLKADPARLEQVLNNLVSNAIKYSPEGGVVSVSVEREDDGVLLSVADEGLGIAADEVPMVFEPFRRTGASRESIPGVGLGLFVSRRLVEAQGGRLTVQTTPGNGSTFSVHLPAA